VARLQQGAEPSTLLDGAEQIAKQALRAAEVLRRLRDFTRKTAPRRELMDLNALANLAINGVDAIVAAGEPRRRLTIETRAAGSQAQVLVSDTGTGLSPEAEQHLFEPFFTTKRGGLGMGLSIARGIVEGHGGRLVLEPPNGAGTTFSVTLPIADSQG
jgi:two-component system, LuxR family, sensor histidine kinase DctS